MKLGLLGGGNMATALVNGVLRAGSLRATQITVSEPDADRRAAISALGIRAVWDNAGVARDADVLILAVKPQQMDAVLDEIRGVIEPPRTLVVSLAAGKQTTDIEPRLPPHTRVVRVMPNTAIMVGAGMSVLCRGRAATDADLQSVQVLFDCCGETLRLDERQFDAVTAVSGSGPAYFYLFTEALTEAGRAAGLPAEAAEQLARQTLLGAGRLLVESGRSARELRTQVTSPGGTTAAALDVFEHERLRDIVRTAVAAATARGMTLARANTSANSGDRGR